MDDGSRCGLASRRTAVARLLLLAMLFCTGVAAAQGGAQEQAQAQAQAQDKDLVKTEDKSADKTSEKVAEKPVNDDLIDETAMGVIPVLRGFNAALVTSSQHDSSNGWSSILTPDVAWRFGNAFSVDMSVPTFTYINVDANVGTTAKPVYRYEIKRMVLGDVAVNTHYELHLKSVGYMATVTMGLPSGDTLWGLGAGKVTFAFNNHFERTFGRFTPDVELGIGDSSTNFLSRVRRSYVAVGALAYFQLGSSVELPRNVIFNAEAYEQLPVGSETIFSTTGSGKKKVTTATTYGAAEDNGFNTSLDVPVTSHMVLSGFYSRSLRNKIDTTGFSMTFLLRTPKAE